MNKGYRITDHRVTSPGNHAYAPVNHMSTMPPLPNQRDITVNSVNAHQSSNSHQSDEYDAALALLSLPVSSQSTSRKTRSNLSLITPQASFDSSRASNAIPFQDLLSDVPNPPFVKQGSTLNQSTTFASSPFYGSCSLSLPQDTDNLSPLHCFVRKFGIEAFVVSEQDAQDKDFWNARNFKVKPGIVGMRCMYCGHRPLRERGPKSVHYPSSTKCIYYSMENWQRHHAATCKYVPKSVLMELNTLMNESKTGSGGRRCYWADSAITLGMVDTVDGIKFASNPEVNAQSRSTDMNHAILSYDAVSNRSVSNTKADDSPIKVVLVEEHDKEVISKYLFVLMSQMESCVFTEEDRAGSRSKVKNIMVGYPGMQCKHCNGKAGVGRYFPFSIQALSLANSDRNIHNHIKKCRRCPKNIKCDLERLRTDAQKPAQKVKRGSRKIFFFNVWKRLHGSDDNDDDSKAAPIDDSKLGENAAFAQEVSCFSRKKKPKKSEPSNEVKDSQHPRDPVLEHPARLEHLTNLPNVKSERYFHSPQATHLPVQAARINLPVQVARSNPAYYANVEYCHNAFDTFHSESLYRQMPAHGVTEVNHYQIHRYTDPSLPSQYHREYHPRNDQIHFRQLSETPNESAMQRQLNPHPAIHQHQALEAHRHQQSYDSFRSSDWKTDRRYFNPPRGRYSPSKYTAL